MAAAFKLFGRWKSTINRGKLMSGSVATMATAVVGWKSWTKSDQGKDLIVFLSKEENGIPSTAKIMSKDTSENRGPLLENGKLNWACTCIERDVVGPCNVKFRILRQFIHDINYDHSNLPPEKSAEMDRIVEDYIFCTFDHLKYYEDTLTEEEKEEEAEQLREKKKKEEIENKKRESLCRDFGKDKVHFLTKAENVVPSKAKISMSITEEERGPLLPNGTVNWSCTCIEREVVGPCNMQFRTFRQYIHDHKGDPADLVEDEQMKLHKIIRSYLDCTRNNPVYYRDYSKSDDDDEHDLSEKEEGDFTKQSDKNIIDDGIDSKPETDKNSHPK